MRHSARQAPDALRFENANACICKDRIQNRGMFQNIRNDYRAHNRDWGAQGFWVMVVYRFGRWRYGVRPASLRKLFSLLYRILFKFVQIITGLELPCEVLIGRNFFIDHFGVSPISDYAPLLDTSP